MKERPIIFSTPMVVAILEGRKTMTRRIIKPQPEKLGDVYKDASQCYIQRPGRALMEWQESETRCPYGNIGDRLWVRETFAPYTQPVMPGINVVTDYLYKADSVFRNEPVDWPWKPSIHMPRSASRIMLEITRIRIERLQNITEGDAIREGVECMSGVYNGQPGLWYRNYHSTQEPPVRVMGAKNSFETLWQKINGCVSWDYNPWVWVIEFRRVQP